MQLNLFKRIFSSIKVKLFLWFWLIIILSVTITSFISHQLTDHAVLMPLHKSDFYHLQQISKRIEHFPVEKILAWTEQKRFRHSARYLSLWLKDNQGQVYAKNKEQNQEIAQYLTSNQLVNPTSIQFLQGRLTGPLSIGEANQRIQVFLLSKTRQPPFGMVIMSLPRWARIMIPVVISFILCWLLARNLTKPIKQLQQASQTIANGKLDVDLTKVSQRYDEIGSLASSFEHMAKQLQQYISAQQRLMADVSHELRSPLTRLQLAVSLLNKQAQTPEQTKYLQRCQLEVDRLEQMLSDVLKLSRLDNSLQPVERLPIYFTQLVEQQVADAEFLATEKHITVHSKLEHNIHYSGDEKLLASAISNLLSNAVKYTPVNGEIWLTLTKSAQWINLEIIDSGEGVPEQSLELLFKPFYRVNNDRSRITGGTGLGLAICKHAIEQHHGTLTAKNAEKNGLIIELKLPC